MLYETLFVLFDKIITEFVIILSQNLYCDNL